MKAHLDVYLGIDRDVQRKLVSVDILDRYVTLELEEVALSTGVVKRFRIHYFEVAREGNP